jgi:4-alpha-glucanotransferase
MPLLKRISGPKRILQRLCPRVSSKILDSVRAGHTDYSGSRRGHLHIHRSIGDNENMEFQRSSGVLLHVSSLPSYGGIGDLGPAAHEFVAFLAAAKQHVWQVLPLCPTGYGNSPYAGSSAFAGNPYLISLEFLATGAGSGRAHRRAGRPGWQRGFQRGGKPQTPAAATRPLANFLDRAPHDPELAGQWKQFEEFCRAESSWLIDYASLCRAARNSTPAHGPYGRNRA